MKVLLAIDALIALLWFVYAVRLPRALRNGPIARAGTAVGEQHARVSVVIPARNEEGLLPRCLDSVRAQTFAVYETIVVDDNSADATARLATERGARVVPAGERPPGWAGKPWATHVGSKAASGDWILFLDADAILAPECVATALMEAERQGSDLLSFMPRPTCSTTLEAIAQPTFMLVMMAALDMGRINDPTKSAAAAWGGFLLFRRASYDAIGGHVAVQNEVIEDLMLARAIKGRGMKLCVMGAPDLVDASRPQSLGRMWDAGYRLVIGAMQGQVLFPAFGAVVIFVCYVAPYLLAPLGWSFAVIAGIHLASVLFVREQLWRVARLDRRFALLQPLGALVLSAVLLRASIAGLGLGTTIRWQRRRYPS